MEIEMVVIALIMLLIICLIIEKRIGRHPVIWSPNEKEPAEETKSAEKEIPEINIPKSIDGKALVYHYDDVDIVPVIGGADMVKVEEQLTLSEEHGAIKVLQGGVPVGTMNENRISEMVRDWKQRGDPILAYISKYTADSTSAQIAIFFYRDQLAAFMKKYPDAKRYRLTGKPDELAGGYSVGDPCTVEMSIDKDDKYEVLHDGSRIGYLPASAVNYARNNGAEPEDLNVAIAEIDYDIDKDRDIISVLISK